MELEEFEQLLARWREHEASIARLRSAIAEIKGRIAEIANDEPRPLASAPVAHVGRTAVPGVDEGDHVSIPDGSPGTSGAKGREAMEGLAALQGAAPLAALARRVTYDDNPDDQLRARRVFNTLRYLRKRGYVEAPAYKGGPYRMTAKGWETLGMEPPAAFRATNAASTAPAPPPVQAVPTSWSPTLNAPPPEPSVGPLPSVAGPPAPPPPVAQAPAPSPSPGLLPRPVLFQPPWPTTR